MPTLISDPGALRALLVDETRAAGFATMGICAPDGIPLAPERLRGFLDAGHHGDMAWMADRATWRGNPAALWPEARSIIMLADIYTPDEDPLTVTHLPDRGAVSVYARGKDYHDGVKKRLKRVARWLVAQTGADVKVFVDTAPVMEKPLAQAAGLGWQGKHTNLLGRDLGSWFFLGAIFTTLDLPKDAPEEERCGSCRRCLDACPTSAFPAPFQLDATRCISYLTIELKGPIPFDLRAPIGNRIYGCDDCLAVCPWNKFAQDAREIAYDPRAELTRPRLSDLVALDDPGFREVFSGSPIKRIGHAKFLRNVLIAIGNSGDVGLAQAAKDRLTDPSPLVRGAAIWALGRLLGAEALAKLRTAPDPEVAVEWDYWLSAINCANA